MLPQTYGVFCLLLAVHLCLSQPPPPPTPEHQAYLDKKNVYQSLSTKEKQKRFLKVFDIIDKNSDSYVSQNELLKWCEEMLRQIDDDGSQLDVRAMDKDRDGLVSFDEFVNYEHRGSEDELEELREEKSASPSNFPKHSLERLNILESDWFRFQLADLNNDKMLSVREYSGFLHSHSYDHMGPYQAKETLSKFDHNKDNRIALDEYVSSTDSEESRMMQTDHFKEFDVNNDDVWDMQEIEAFSSPGMSINALKSMRDVLYAADINKDGKISKYEAQQKQTEWVDGHMTKFGQLVHDEL